MSIGAIAAVKYHDTLFFSGFISKGIFAYDCKKNTIKKISDISCEINEGLYHKKALIYKNQAWFLPWDAKKILCLDLDSYSEKYFDVPDCDFDKHCMVDYLLHDNGCLYFIPHGEVKTLVIIDLDTHKIDYYPNVINRGRCIGAFITGNILYLLSSKGTVLTEFNINSRTIVRMEELDETTQYVFSSIIQDEKCVYLIPRCSETVCVIDRTTKERNYYQLPNTKEEYEGGLVTNSSVIMFPRNHSQRYLVYHKDTSRIIEKPRLSKFRLEGMFTMGGVDTDSEDIMAIALDGQLIEFNDDGDIINESSYLVDENDIIDISKDNTSARKEALDWVVNKNLILKENKRFGLSEYVRSI